MTAPSFANGSQPPPPPPAATPAPPTGAPASNATPSGESIPATSPNAVGRRRSRVPLFADLAAIVLIIGSTALSIFAWRSIFADLGFIAPMMGVSIATAATVMVATRRRWSVPSSFLVSLVVAVVGLAAHHGADVADLPNNLIEGWKALASTGLLIPSESRFVVVPTVIGALATWIATEAVVRRRSSAPAVLALLAGHAAAAAYTISQWQPTWWFAAALSAILGLLLAVSGLTRPGGASFEDGRVDVTMRQIGSAVTVVGVLAAVAAGLMALLGTPDDGGITGRAFDLRQSLVRPLDITESATPLARVKAGLVDEDNSTVFTVSVDGLSQTADIPLLPVAILDRYDGTIWSTTARFEVAGSSLPAPSLANPSAGQVAVAIDLTDQYPFRFLPQVGILEQVTEGDLAWDPITGTVAALDPAADGYRGVVAPVTSVELPDAAGGTDSSLAGVGDRADLTDEQRQAMNAYLAEIVDADADPLDQLRAIQADLLSERFGYNENAPAGHSLAALTSYLWPTVPEGADDTAVVEAVSRAGFSEHAAASFAVLARELGVPSRVVVGYLLDEPITAANSEVLVTENMIHAWPEVWVDGTGWIRLDVTNKINETPDEPDRTPAVSAASVEANATDLPDVEEPVILPDDELSTERSRLWYLLAVPLLPLLYFVAVFAAKALRRARRKRRAADHRVVGAWRETQDRFRELGLPSSPSLSALDVAEELDVIDLRQVGDPLIELAPRLDTALYAPLPATDTDADKAWEAADLAIGEARKASSTQAKVRAAFDPRSLLHR